MLIVTGQLHEDNDISYRVLCSLFYRTDSDLNQYYLENSQSGMWNCGCV